MNMKATQIHLLKAILVLNSSFSFCFQFSSMVTRLIPIHAAATLLYAHVK